MYWVSKKWCPLLCLLFWSPLQSLKRFFFPSFTLMHLPSSSFIHTSLCVLFFANILHSLWNTLQSELQLYAICLPTTHGLGHIKRSQSRIFTETLYSIIASFFNGAACDNDHFGVTYWAKHLAFEDVNAQLNLHIIKPLKLWNLSAKAATWRCFLNLALISWLALTNIDSSVCLQKVLFRETN